MALKRPKNPTPSKSNVVRTLLFWASLALIALFLVSVFVQPGTASEKPLSDIIARANQGKIEKLLVQQQSERGRYSGEPPALGRGLAAGSGKISAA